MVTDKPIERRLGQLRTWNIAVGLILAVQAIMIALLTNNFSLPVTATFMSGPPGTAPQLQLFLGQNRWHGSDGHRHQRDLNCTVQVEHPGQQDRDCRHNDVHRQQRPSELGRTTEQVRRLPDSHPESEGEDEQQDAGRDRQLGQ